MRNTNLIKKLKLKTNRCHYPYYLNYDSSNIRIGNWHCPNHHIIKLGDDRCPICQCKIDWLGFILDKKKSKKIIF